MKTTFLALLFSAIFNTINAQTIEITVDSNNVFAFKLFNVLKSDHNLIFSPFSISSALAMTYAGARGETEKQMSHVLCFGMQQEPLHNNFESIIKTIEMDNGDSIRLNIANSLWAQNSYHFLDSYFTLVKTNYHNELNYVDFINEPEKARLDINSWVEQKTNDKIKDLLPEGSIDGMVRLVLVNALYFHGAWKWAFNPISTRKDIFYLNRTDTVLTDFMENMEERQHYVAEYNYYEDNKFQVVEIPYNNDKLAMLIFLPNEIGDINEMENNFTLGYYTRVLRHMKADLVNLSIPKFKTTMDFNLANTLSKMGMPIAFADTANFSGMTGNKDLYISEVFHKAFINVTEQGTEAAAATAIVMSAQSASIPPPTKTFKADHPFIFILFDYDTGTILFMGELKNPQQ
ncbi:MAG: serpin family protein [Bacteroidia bacterium]